MKNLAFILIFATVVSHALVTPISDKDVADSARQCREYGGALAFQRDMLGRVVYTECHLEALELWEDYYE